MGPFERSFLFLSRRRAVLPALLLALIALAVAGAFQVRFEEDIFALLPPDEPRVAETRLALERYRGLERIVVALESDEPAALAAAVDQADEALRQVRGVQSVVSRLEQSAQEDIFNLYAGAAPLLFDDDLQSRIEARLTTGEFAARLQGYLDRQAGKEGMTVADSFRDDPLGFDELVFRRFEHLSAGFRGGRDAQGRILSPDGRFAVLFVQADFPSSDTGRGREFMVSLEGALPAGVTTHVVGAHRSSVDNANVLRTDLNLTVATSAIGILLLFLVAFRSVTAILLPLLSVGFGFAVALGVQGWVHGELSAITAGFSAVLLGIAVDYGVHLVTTCGSEVGDRAQRAQSAIAHVGRPAFIAALTTIAAILMLRFSRFDGLHQLSEMAVVGIAGALLFAIFAGPQLLRLAGPKAGAAQGVSRVLGSLSSARFRARKALLAAGVIVTVALGCCIPLVGFDGDVMNLDGKGAATRASEAAVQQAFGQDTLSRTLVVSGGDTLESALRENDLNARALHAVGAGFDGISWVLPAPETQRENLERWRRFWNERRISALTETMAAAKATRPDTGAETGLTVAQLERGFAGFFSTLRLVEPPEVIEPKQVRDKPIWALMSGFVSDEGRRAYIGATATMDEAMADELRALAPSAIVLNKASFTGRMVRFIRDDLLLVGGMSLLLVVTLLVLTFGRLRDVAIALVPVAGGMIWTLGLMGLLGIRFNIINTLVTVFIAGLGIDYGIFFVQTWRGSRDAAEVRRRLLHAGSGVTIAALTTLFGFGSLALASHPALFSVGVTTAIGVLSALVLTLFVVPTLLELGAASTGDARD
jgi:predicted RND superfamily exporter protein